LLSYAIQISNTAEQKQSTHHFQKYSTGLSGFAPVVLTDRLESEKLAVQSGSRFYDSLQSVVGLAVLVLSGCFFACCVTV